jgi:hypothetical protein
VQRKNVIHVLHKIEVLRKFHCVPYFPPFIGASSPNTRHTPLKRRVPTLVKQNALALFLSNILNRNTHILDQLVPSDLSWYATAGDRPEKYISGIHRNAKESHCNRHPHFS